MTKHIYSKILTALPIILAHLMIIANVQFNYEIDQSAVSLIEFLVGSTVLGGVGNAAFRKYLDYKKKLLELPENID